MRISKIGVAIIASIVALTFFANDAAAQLGGSRHDQNTLEGTWLATSRLEGDTDDTFALQSFTREGSLIQTDGGTLSLGMALTRGARELPTLQLTQGHGTWVAGDGGVGWVVGVLLFAKDLEGNLVGTAAVVGDVRLSSDRQSYSGTFEAVLAALDGTILESTRGVVSADRITFE